VEKDGRYLITGRRFASAAARSDPASCEIGQLRRPFRRDRWFLRLFHELRFDGADGGIAKTSGDAAIGGDAVGIAAATAQAIAAVARKPLVVAPPAA
jgi:hypothetical protein